MRILAIGDDRGGVKGDDALYYTTLLLKSGEDMMVQMEEQLDYYVTNMKEKPYVVALLKFVVNFLLYMSSPDIVLENVAAKYTKIEKRASDKEKARIDEKNSGLSKISAISIGKGVECFQSMANYYGGTAVRDRVVGCPRWLVRGHWRSQAFGPGRSQHKPRWIQPYEKGPGITSSLLESREYEVK